MADIWFAPIYFVIGWSIYLAVWSWNKGSGSTTKSKEPWRFTDG